MKFLYEYRTCDNVHHEGQIEAVDREAAFAALKARGIRPGKVWEAPGLLNRVLGRGKRWMAIGVLCTVCIALCAALYRLSQSNNRRIEQSNNSLTSPRHQIYGDPEIMEKFERGDFGTNLVSRGNEILAWFAQPGKIMAPKESFSRRCTPAIEKALGEATSSSLQNKDANNSFRSDEDVASPIRRNCFRSDGDVASPVRRNCFRSDGDVASPVRRPHVRSDGDVASPCDHIPICSQDSRELKELKQIVNGLREEMRGYLANGNGTVKSYYRRLVERTSHEIQIYERTRRELENEKNPAVWEQKNEALRKLGLRTIPNPNEKE